ncbi:hypothetical protein C6P42_002164 [Pichia californica]|nr:hypothetical protein C6P42_002164 [[Candida] californica]
MNFSSLEKSKFLTKAVTKQLNDILCANGKSQEALKILNTIQSKNLIDFGVTTIANQIFIRDSNPIQRELYKDFLKKMKLEVDYFEIPRLLNNDQYEQAALLSIRQFDKLSQIKYLSDDKSASNLQMFKILIEATARNDTVIILQLLTRLNRLHVLTEENYSHILSLAITNNNETLLINIYDDIIRSNINLTDDTWEYYAGVFIKSQDSEKVLKIIERVKSVEVKNVICLKWISTLDFKECMLLLDSLINDKTFEFIEYNDLPTPLISIQDLHMYSNISEKISVLNELSLVHTKELLIHSLLSSIDNTDTHLRSTIFLINGLGFNKDLLNERHKDIIFHQISKYSYKLTSLKLFKFFKKQGLKFSVINYLHILKCQCHGEEHDTLFYLLIEVLQDYRKVPTEIVKFLKELNNSINDNRLNLFFSKTAFQSIDDIKYEINYEFLGNRLEYEQQRTKTDHNVIDNYSEYKYEKDIELVDSLDL